MVTQINILSDPTDANNAFMSQGFNAALNSMILCSLLNEIYTGIVAVTLWNISEINTVIYKSQSIRQAMIAIIILLYIASTINFAFEYQIILGANITSAISTILADSTMIWHYWIVWGQQWLIVLPPIFLLVSAIGYFDFLAAIARGSTASSSLHFGTHSGGHDSQQDSILNDDLEAQQMIDDEYGHYTAVESQEDIGINSSESIIHRDYNGLEVLEIQV
ncbi:uncharacterized protein BT62DRAFT_915610 [Guyanagaster necrorhizus]|uniref:Uncharacterized protein n=1 Tax=Guyanagaster necrorhizus TaxID=856835 RepID=A0A9P7W347_9AGAR|nr:uncharacterized protein BT62DRAFT_915610 [Guyanagaster necrorhizus MCA 3950]KAG7451772.1 hypothetical protein BT62DRAFT_915610 [Guyanagaster necrorhizus MCA 3950]